MEDELPEFTLAEIKEMQILFKEMGEKSMSEAFCQELATRFSCSVHQTGRTAIKAEQVQGWFLDKQKQLTAKVTTSPAARVKIRAKKDCTSRVNEISQKPKGERIASLSELAFEAKSAKDFAWYDVAAFLNYRVLCTGELEARVRFAGFSYDQDEWVDVKTEVRDRSIPLEPSECNRVKVGDLVLCFRETDELAIYCDAYVVEIHRKVHDANGCRCIFMVRYDYDNAKGEVDLTRLCCRPS